MSVSAVVSRLYQGFRSGDMIAAYCDQTLQEQCVNQKKQLFFYWKLIANCHSLNLCKYQVILTIIAKFGADHKIPKNLFAGFENLIPALRSPKLNCMENEKSA